MSDDLARETELRRAAEAHVRALRAALEQKFYSDEVEAIVLRALAFYVSPHEAMPMRQTEHMVEAQRLLDEAARRNNLDEAAGK